VTSKKWEVRLSPDAELDFDNILRWSAERFGVQQAWVYADILADALDALKDGPETIGVRPRRDIENGLYTLHVARYGRRGRHFILFRVAEDESRQLIYVLRLMHDAMDIARYVAPEEGQE
jgi:toxin ParE1/3/4